MKTSPTTGIQEIEIDKLPNSKKIVLNFPKEIKQIRLNLQNLISEPNAIPHILENEQNEQNTMSSSSTENEIQPIPPRRPVHIIKSKTFYRYVKEGIEVPPGARPITKKNINKTKIKYLKDNLEEKKCIKKIYLTKFWKQFFPKLTSVFDFNKKNIYCNYELAILILKDFNSNIFHNISILDIKRILITYYTPIINSKSLSRELYEKKWSREFKQKYVDRLKQRITTIESIIMDETYKISETDLLILAYNFNIPIVVLYQSKNGIIKTSSFEKSNKYEYKYYVKATNDSILYLHVNKENIRFDNVDNRLKSHVEKNSYDKFEDYLYDKKRKLIYS